MLKTILAASAILALTSLPALAQSAIQRVTARRAQGIESEVVEIKVYPYETGSLIINFRPTQEIVRQVSLVSSSLFLSSDDPNCLSSQAQGSSSPCGATLLYLQQKPTESVPAARRVSSTRMTVLTDNNIYLFDLTLASGKPTYSVVEILPDSRQYTPLVSLEQITVLRQGFQVAVTEQYVSNPELNSRLREFLDLVRSAESVESAAAQAGISMEVVRKLEELGSRKPSQPSEPSQVSH